MEVIGSPRKISGDLEAGEPCVVFQQNQGKKTWPAEEILKAYVFQSLAQPKPGNNIKEDVIV